MSRRSPARVRPVIDWRGPHGEGFLKVFVTPRRRNREPWVEISGDSYRYHVTFDLMDLFKQLQAQCSATEQQGLLIAGSVPPFVRCPARLERMVLDWLTQQPAEWVIGWRRGERVPVERGR